jgi:Co/Zn/Cd efflux system component
LRVFFIGSDGSLETSKRSCVDRSSVVAGVGDGTAVRMARNQLQAGARRAGGRALSEGCSSDGCGCGGNPRFDGMDPGYRHVLWAVIAINAAMFIVEMTAGHLAGSRALQADALDFLGDTLTYGISLAVIGSSLRVRASAALFKGFSLSVVGLWVMGSTAYSVFVLGLPRAEIMGGIGFLAFAANLASVLLLLRYKDGDANVRSVWLCSRNDAVGNLAVLFAAGAVWLTAAAWPDLVVAAAMAALFLNSSFLIFRQAFDEYRHASMAAPHSE